MENSEITIYEGTGPGTKNSPKKTFIRVDGLHKELWGGGGEVVKEDYMKREKIEVAFCEIDAQLLYQKRMDNSEITIYEGRRPGKKNSLQKTEITKGVGEGGGD